MLCGPLLACLCTNPVLVPAGIDQAVDRAAQKADDLRRWEEYLAGRSGPQPPFAI